MNISQFASPFYEPAVYLSILACGIPSAIGKKLKLIIHNQRLDSNNIHEVLKSLEQRLSNIEEAVCREQVQIDMRNMEEEDVRGRDSDYYDEEDQLGEIEDSEDYL